MKKTNSISSLYIHIPFCESICDYCDFAKLQYFHNFAEQYLIALEKELHDVVINKDLKTIYIGGGTPTSLSNTQFEKLLSMVESYAKKAKEFTIEANPESLSLSKIKLLKKYHVNRVSIGVESTDDRILKAINRKHTFEDVKKVVNNLKENGIENINLDLIIGLPNVTRKMLIKDIKNILSLNPKHISAYSLTVHEHTKFYLDGVIEPDDDYAYESYKKINKLLENSGYSHYEVSNWAKKGFESQHNLTYWKNQRYYGIGLAASGYIGDIRYKNTTNFQQYISFKNEKETEKVSLDDEKDYEIMLKLRTKHGINLKEFKMKFDEDFYQAHEKSIKEFIKHKYLRIVNGSIIPTFSGMMKVDTIYLNL